MVYLSRVFRRHWFVAWLALVGCGGPGTNLPPLPPVDVTSYTLGPGDQVRIITFGEENLTGEFRVNDPVATSPCHCSARFTRRGSPQANWKPPWRLPCDGET